MVNLPLGVAELVFLTTKGQLHWVSRGSLLSLMGVIHI